VSLGIQGKSGFQMVDFSQNLISYYQTIWKPDNIMDLSSLLIALTSIDHLYNNIFIKNGLGL
jgi:hypothetical protein